MAKQSLAVKYRPQSFDDLTEQGAIKKILTSQVESNEFQHAYLFIGPAGTGKTTSARIFANMINHGQGTPIEIDAASNSGVDNIRQVISDSKRKPLDCDYKLFIVDECHSLSSGAWQAMLKLLEEPPAFSIFILCTTNPEKIPATILSRVQQFQFNKISNDGIVERLKVILDNEHIASYEDAALNYIAVLSAGGMRDSITLLDKCLSYSENVTLDNVLHVVGAEDYSTFRDYLTSLVDKDSNAIKILDDVYLSGKDLKQFIKDFTRFTLDVATLLIFGTSPDNFKYITFPCTEQNVTYVQGLKNNLNDVYKVVQWLMPLQSLIKWESNPRVMLKLQTIGFISEAD